MKMFMFTKLCRLCINDKDVASTLNNFDSDNIIMLDKLNRIAPRLLKVNNNLPNGICETCIAQLHQSYKFLQNCFRSQEILEKYFSQLQNGLYAEQSENYEIVLNAIKLEQNNAINYMNDMNTELTDEEFPNTLMNYVVTMEQENSVGGSESIHVNFEDDSKVEESDMNHYLPNVKTEVIEECYADTIDIEIGKNVKKELECPSEDAIALLTDIKNEITEENVCEESGFIKQENIIEYNDAYESIQVNFEDDIEEKETNVKMEISEEECNYSIDTQSNINVKEELESLSEDIIDFKNEIIEEHLYETNIIDYECTEVKCEDEIKIEDHDSKNSFVDIPTITEQSDFCGFNLREYSLANDIKVKYNFELNRLCENTNKFLIDFQNEKKSSNSKNLKNVRKALERSSTRKPRQICTGYRGKSQTNLKQPIQNRHSDNLNTRQVPCSICKKLYASKNSLWHHMKLHNARERRHRCTICTKAFYNTSHFNQHMRQHTGERPHKCEHCDKAFATISNCRRHVRTHTGERPFQCKFCEKKFGDSSTLSVHTRIHTGERPFQCKFCEKKFGDSSALLVHTRIHTGERPYKCEHCSKTFNASGDCKKHLKVHRDRTAGKIN